MFAEKGDEYGGGEGRYLKRTNTPGIRYITAKWQEMTELAE